MEIRNWATGKIIVENDECATIKELVEWCVENNISLEYANIEETDLSDINLENVNFEGVDLSDTDLTNANLKNAKLEGTILYNTILDGCNLRKANLSSIKDDFQTSIEILPNEIIGLRNALVEGRVDGNQYEGECVCLVGTLANNMGLDNYKDLEKIYNFPIDYDSPRESWFLGIKEDDTPENSQIVAITIEWIDEVIQKLKLQ